MEQKHTGQLSLAITGNPEDQEAFFLCRTQPPITQRALKITCNDGVMTDPHMIANACNNIILLTLENVK